MHELLLRDGKSASDVTADRKGAPWKIEIAAELKQLTQAPHRWIAQQLQMGSGAAVGQYVARYRKRTSAEIDSRKFN